MLIFFFFSYLYVLTISTISGLSKLKDGYLNCKWTIPGEEAYLTCKRVVSTAGVLVSKDCEVSVSVPANLSRDSVSVPANLSHDSVSVAANLSRDPSTLPSCVS